MRIPRDISGEQLAKLLDNYGYIKTRQIGSQVRLTTHKNGEHHLTIPLHKTIRVGTLNGILKDAADHLSIDKEVLIAELFSN